ncbi:MAG TPA: arsenite methyltransferase [Methanoregulaceae archaeon]|nr:arsenite methyltransferase [Methanoregulaceae archaeon]HOV67897.1 arsenite methyltransferase [Methanoregulaceae archaeon]HQJ87848.1 arsenite methyltransferase [Methanoregulaceae archaeon]
MERDERVHEMVRDGYTRVAEQSCGCGCGTGCCGSSSDPREISRAIGYSEEEMGAVPSRSNLGLGCGNPVALAGVAPGETVLDLGSGAGFDAFLAARQVGEAGRVIGVDMTPAMITRARENAREGGYHNVEFRLGEIEHLPVADRSIDVVISNCVINLSPRKEQVFAEAFRVLRPGGRLLVSDMVMVGDLPGRVRTSVSAYVGCIAGAVSRERYLALIRRAGFVGVEVLEETAFPLDWMKNDPTAQVVLGDLELTPAEREATESAIASIRVRAVRPA